MFIGLSFVTGISIPFPLNTLTDFCKKHDDFCKVTPEIVAMFLRYKYWTQSGKFSHFIEQSISLDAFIASLWTSLPKYDGSKLTNK